MNDVVDGRKWRGRCLCVCENEKKGGCGRNGLEVRRGRCEINAQCDTRERHTGCHAVTGCTYAFFFYTKIRNKQRVIAPSPPTSRLRSPQLGFPFVQPPVFFSLSHSLVVNVIFKLVVDIAELAYETSRCCSFSVI